MFTKIYDKIKNFMKENYKYILGLIVFYLILTYPLDYYIFTGGGISNINTRITVEDGYKEKGSLNISYVSELQGNTLTYILSYIMPNWKREKINNYKYDDNETIEDINFRSNLDLESTNSRAVKIAYELAGKDYKTIDTKIYVTYVSDEYKTALKVKDQILTINDKHFETTDEYKKYINTLEEGDTVKVKVLRNKEEKIINTKIYKLKDRLILGVMLEQLSTYEVNPKIKIKFNSREQGPSGGLITTLYIYNQLTEKDLTNSYKIAGTGTIEEDHTIGEIGEVKYKLLGAVKEKADVFIVPNGTNYKTCIKVKKEKNLKIKIIGVSTIEEAIQKLGELK